MTANDAQRILRNPRMFTDADYRAAIDADLQSPQSTARDFGAPEPTSMGLRRIVWACAAIAVGLFIGWLVTRAVQGAAIDAETARAMASAYLGGM